MDMISLIRSLYPQTTHNHDNSLIRSGFEDISDFKAVYDLYTCFEESLIVFPISLF